MDRRSFLSNMSAASLASIAGATTLTAKADALEDAMSVELDKRIATPWMCSIDPHSGTRCRRYPALVSARGSAPAGYAGSADADRFLQVALRALESRSAKRAAGEEQWS